MPRSTSRVGTRRQLVRIPRQSIKRLATRMRQRRHERQDPHQAIGGPAPRGDGAEVTHASGGTKVAHTGGGRQIIYARDRAEVAPASDGRGGPRAHDVNGRRWVRGERGGARVDGPEIPGCSKGDTLRLVVEGRRCAAGPMER